MNNNDSQTLFGWQHFIRRFPHVRLLWEAQNATGDLRAYALVGKVVIIHDYADGNGWTAYVDPFITLDIEETFSAIAQHCENRG